APLVIRREQGVGLRLPRGLRSHAPRGGGLREAGSRPALGRVPRHCGGGKDGALLRPSGCVRGRRRRPSASRELVGPERASLGRLTFEQCSLPLAARRYDLVHLCDFRPLVLSRSRFLLTIHDVFFLQNPEWFPARVARYKTFMLDLAVAKRPAQIVCVSEWTRE